MENSCLFDEQIDPPGKFMSVRRTNGLSWKIIKLIDQQMKDEIPVALEYVIIYLYIIYLKRMPKFRSISQIRGF